MNMKENQAAVRGKRTYEKPQFREFALQVASLLEGSLTGAPDDGNGNSGMPFEQDDNNAKSNSWYDD